MSSYVGSMACFSRSTPTQRLYELQIVPHMAAAWMVAGVIAAC